MVLRVVAVPVAVLVFLLLLDGVLVALLEPALLALLLALLAALLGGLLLFVLLLLLFLLLLLVLLALKLVAETLVDVGGVLGLPLPAAGVGRAVPFRERVDARLPPGCGPVGVTLGESRVAQRLLRRARC